VTTIAAGGRVDIQRAFDGDETLVLSGTTNTDYEYVMSQQSRSK